MGTQGPWATLKGARGSPTKVLGSLSRVPKAPGRRPHGRLGFSYKSPWAALAGVQGPRDALTGAWGSPTEVLGLPSRVPGPPGLPLRAPGVLYNIIPDISSTFVAAQTGRGFPTFSGSLLHISSKASGTARRFHSQDPGNVGRRFQSRHSEDIGLSPTS